jgi:RND superfamily putative drug exporter
VVTLGVAGHGKENDNITIPGTESQHVANLLKQKLPALSGAQTQVAFVSNAASSVTSSAHSSAIEAAVRRMGRVSQVAEVTNPVQTTTISADGREALATVQWKVASGAVNNSSVSALQRAASPAHDAGLKVAYGGEVYPGSKPNVGETPELIGVVIAFVILLVALGALVAAGMPILNALIGLAISVSAILALASVVDIATVSTTVATMLGLSTGIDYGLFILSRHRSQLLAGQPLGESVATAVGTAGSSVVFAGATVMVALIGLGVVGIPFLRVMGLVAAGAVGVSVLIALTLLPAVLGFAGEKVTRFIHPPLMPSRPERAARLAASQPERTAGASWARFVVRHRIAVLLAGVALLLALAYPLTSLRLGQPDGASQPASNTAHQEYDYTSQHFGPGYNGVLLAVANPVTRAETRAITANLAKVPDVLRVAPADYGNQTGAIEVVPKAGPDASATTSLVNRIRDERQRLAGNTGAQLLLGGPTATDIDVANKLSSALPIFLITIVGLAFVLLTFAFRTALVPIKSILGFLLSIAAALGATVALFQWGWGASLLGVTKSQVTLSYLPTILLAIIFGLSSDYEVFVVSRIKEHFTKTGDAREAVRHGAGVSLRVVSAAALIMFSIFAAFTTTNNVDIKPIAFSFAVGVLIDAFVVRLTLVPAIMAIAGGKLWYHPKWFAKYVPDPDIEGLRLKRPTRGNRPGPLGPDAPLIPVPDQA